MEWIVAGPLIATAILGGAVAIWLPAPAGLVALGALRARVARWAAEDAAPAEAEPAAVAAPVALPAEPPFALTVVPAGPRFVSPALAAADAPAVDRHAARMRPAVLTRRPADCTAC